MTAIPPNEPLRAAMNARAHYAEPLLPAVYVPGSPEREWLITHMAGRMTGDDDAAEAAIDALFDLGCTLTLGTRECDDCGAEVSAHLYANGCCSTCRNAALAPDKEDDE